MLLFTASDAAYSSEIHVRSTLRSDVKRQTKTRKTTKRARLRETGKDKDRERERKAGRERNTRIVDRIEDSGLLEDG